MDRYSYESVGGFVVDNEDHKAIITAIKHQRLGMFIVDMLNEKENKIKQLKHEMTILQYENEKHIESRKINYNTICELQAQLLENKTEKEKKLEKELDECEKFRYSVFKAMEILQKQQGDKDV